MPDLSPLLSAPLPIQIHAFAAMNAIVLGGVQFGMRKGGARHRVIGHAFALSMAVTALSSFLIFELRIFGPFSPIHLLSLFSIWAIFNAIGHARAGRIKQHARAMKLIYILALLITALFTVLPGRIMHDVIF